MLHKYVMTAFVALLLGATALGLGAAMDAPRSLMSRADRDREVRVIERHTRVALGECRALESSSREVCRARSRAEDRIARAELEARYLGTVAAAQNAGVVRAQARIDVARAQCRADDPGTVSECVAAARADEARKAQLASAT